MNAIVPLRRCTFGIFLSFFVETHLRVTVNKVIIIIIIIVIIIQVLCIIRVSVLTQTIGLYGFVFTMPSFHYYIFMLNFVGFFGLILAPDH